MKPQPLRSSIALLLILTVALGVTPRSIAGTLVTLTPDAANTSAPAFGSNVNSPLLDPFAYDCEAPTDVLPQQLYNPGAAGFHGNEPDGVDVIVVYTTTGTVMLADGETFVLDLYGRDGANDCCAERDDDLDIELFSGGIAGTSVALFEGLTIPNEAPYHLRVTFDGAEFDTIRITAHDTDNPAGSYFTLMEIRAAILIDPTDTDEDGLPDAWEILHGLDHLDDGSTDPVNGASGDPDNDGLDNMGEFDHDTDPRDPDSDDDLLEDGAEVNGAGARPPTDPNNPDSDSDTLSDLVETNTGVFLGASDTGSNPRSVDTDMDGASDAAEVARGTDPSDPESGNNLAVGKTGGFFTADDIATGAWGGLPATNVLDGNLASFSHPLDQAAAGYYFELDLGEEVLVGAIELTGRGDGCCPERLEDATLVILNEARQEVFSQSLEGQIQATRELDLTASQALGRYVQIVNSNGSDYAPQLGEIAVYASGAPGTPFVITAFATDTVTGAASLTFNSIPGASYAVFGSNSMQGLWAEVDDSVDSQGEVTTYEFTDADLIGQPRRFYQVRRN